MPALIVVLCAQFLQRHRVEAHYLAIPILEQIGSMLAQREKLVHGRYHTLLERETGWTAWGSGAILVECQLSLSLLIFAAGEDLLGTEASDEGVEKMVISKCYTKVAVSTNPRTAEK